MWRCASLSILVAVVATGCQDEPRTHSVVVISPPAESVAAAASPTPPAPPPTPPDVVPLPEHKPDAAGAAPAAAGPNPKELVGLDFRETEAFLGLPTKQEEKPPAKVWTYSGTDCELTIFFYADINTQEFRALTYEFRGNEATGGSDDQCLAQLKQGT